MFILDPETQRIVVGLFFTVLLYMPWWGWVILGVICIASMLAPAPPSPDA